MASWRPTAFPFSRQFCLQPIIKDSQTVPTRLLRWCQEHFAIDCPVTGPKFVCRQYHFGLTIAENHQWQPKTIVFFLFSSSSLSLALTTQLVLSSLIVNYLLPTIYFHSPRLEQTLSCSTAAAELTFSAFTSVMFKLVLSLYKALEPPSSSCGCLSICLFVYELQVKIAKIGKNFIFNKSRCIYLYIFY